MAASVVQAAPAPACTPCGTLMVKGPEGWRCLNCGATIRVVRDHPQSPASGPVYLHRIIPSTGPSLANGAEVEAIRDVADQSAAALEDQHRAAALALGMSPAEPWDVLTRRMRDNAKQARGYLALMGALADLAEVPKPAVRGGKGR